jgi:hypothetical protein
VVLVVIWDYLDLLDLLEKLVKKVELDSVAHKDQLVDQDHREIEDHKVNLV